MTERRPRTRAPERDLVTAARSHLEEQGYRVWIDPDGHDYFDLVARRGDEIGLVEAKVANARAVLQQALRRRVWGDWSAVVLSGARSAEGVVRRSAAGRAAAVGVWWVDRGTVRVARAPRPWAGSGEPDPYAPLRARFRQVLDALESGALPAGVPWDGVVSEVRRASRGRGFSEWRLDEPPPE